MPVGWAHRTGERHARGCLHLFWRVGSMSTQLDLQLSTAQRVSTKGGAGPLQLLRGTSRAPASLRSRSPTPRLPPGTEEVPSPPDRMPASMLPCAWILMLLGGKCHLPPSWLTAEVGREGARPSDSPGPWGLPPGSVHRGCCCLLLALPQPHLAGTCCASRLLVGPVLGRGVIAPSVHPSRLPPPSPWA